jgi:hypothetical protein
MSIDMNCAVCKIDLYKQQYRESHALPIKKEYVPHCYKCGYEIKIRREEELETHIKNLQKLLGKYALHVEDLEGVDFLEPFRNSGYLTDNELDYVSECKRGVEK